MRESLGLDLLNPQHYFQILASLTDRLAFCFLLVETEAKVIGVNADEFEERLYGEGIADQASVAFLEETELFFQKLGQSGMANLAKVSMETMKLGQAKMNELIENGVIDSAIAQATMQMAELSVPRVGSGLLS